MFTAYPLTQQGQNEGLQDETLPQVGMSCEKIPLTLCIQTSFSCLVLCDLVHRVLLAVLVLAEGPLGFWNVDLHSNYWQTPPCIPRCQYIPIFTLKTGTTALIMRRSSLSVDFSQGSIYTQGESITCAIMECLKATIPYSLVPCSNNP